MVTPRDLALYIFRALRGEVEVCLVAHCDEGIALTDGSIEEEGYLS